MTKFGSKYKNHPTPKWLLILATSFELLFTSIAAGTLGIPDNVLWWKYVVAVSGFMVLLIGRLKPYFGDETTYPLDPELKPTV